MVPSKCFPKRLLEGSELRLLRRQAVFLYPMSSSDVSHQTLSSCSSSKLSLAASVEEPFSRYSTPLLRSLIPQMPPLDPSRKPCLPFDFHSFSYQALSTACPLSRVCLVLTLLEHRWAFEKSRLEPRRLPLSPWQTATRYSLGANECHSSFQVICHFQDPFCVVFRDAGNQRCWQSKPPLPFYNHSESC